MQARDIMTSQVITATPDMTVEEVTKLLLEHRISGLPVVDDENRVIGIVSEGDLIFRDKEIQAPRLFSLLGGIIFLENPKRFEEEVRKAFAAKVEDLMTEKVVTVPGWATTTEIATIMAEKKVNRVPVVDEDGKLLGIVTRSDLVKTLVRS